MEERKNNDDAQSRRAASKHAYYLAHKEIWKEQNKREKEAGWPGKKKSRAKKK